MIKLEISFPVAHYIILPPVVKPKLYRTPSRKMLLSQLLPGFPSSLSRKKETIIAEAFREMNISPPPLVRMKRTKQGKVGVKCGGAKNKERKWRREGKKTSRKEKEKKHQVNSY